MDGEAPAPDAGRPSAKSVRTGELREGAQVFEDSIAGAPVEEQARLRELCPWARGLEAEGVVRDAELLGNFSSTAPPGRGVWPGAGPIFVRPPHPWAHSPTLANRFG